LHEDAESFKRGYFFGESAFPGNSAFLNACHWPVKVLEALFCRVGFQAIVGFNFFCEDEALLSCVALLAIHPSKKLWGVFKSPYKDE
jgi:hypothetical protein